MKKKFSINIEKIVYGGYGLARVGGKVVFIPFTAPGDRVSVEAIKEKKDFIEARLISVENPSPLRTEPFCGVFGRCGGCQYQYLKYEDQLRIKTEILEDSLIRLRKRGPFEFHPIIPSARDRACRIRAQMKIGRTERRAFVGFHRFKTHEVVEIKTCPMLDPLADEVLLNFQVWIMEEEQVPALRGIDILVSPDEGAAIIRIYGGGLGEEAGMGKMMGETGKIKGWVWEGKKEGSRGETTLWFHAPNFLGDEPLRVGVDHGSFYQTNADQNRELIHKVIEWAGLIGKEKVLDLFCGAGNLTLPLAQKAREAWGIDADEGAIARAAENARQNGAANCRFMAASAEAEIRALAQAGESFDLVVLDPPRAGAKEVMDSLARLRPTRILYVSCEPPTLIRDLVRLTDLGYNVTRIQALDMFPQTYHMEVIAELSAVSCRPSA